MVLLCFHYHATHVSSACGNSAQLNPPVFQDNRKFPGVCPVLPLQQPRGLLQGKNAALVVYFGGRRYPE